MSRAIIRDLLESRLAAWAAAQVPPLPIAWENVDFPSTQTKPYLRAFLLTAPTGAPDLAGAIHEYAGVFQVTGVFAQGTGTAAAEAFEAAMDSLFPVNLQLTGSGVRVQMVSPMSAPAATPEPDCLTIAVSARYQSFV